MRFLFAPLLPAVAIAASSIAVGTAEVFAKTITGATTLAVANVPPAGTVGCFVLQLTNGGAYAVTWWTGIKWAGGTAPALTTAGVDALVFWTIDGGSTWFGAAVKDFK